MGSFTKIKEILSKGDNFLVIGHENPDGDCLGSLLALESALKNLGKHTTLVIKDVVPSFLKFLPGTENIKHDFLFASHEIIILIDNGDFKRTGFSDRLLLAKKKKIPIINIDHHPKNDLWRIASVNFAREDSSSTAELIFEILTGMNLKITPQIATCLLSGVYNDTGGFQHSNTSKKVFAIASELLKSGAKLKQIADNFSNSKTTSMLKLWGIALSRLSLNKKYKIIYSVLQKNDIKKSGATEDEVAGLISLISTTKEAKAAMLIYETLDGKIKGSIRTEDCQIDVSVLAKKLLGGGHKKASGFSFDGKIVCENDRFKIV